MQTILWRKTRLMVALACGAATAFAFGTPSADPLSIIKWTVDGGATDRVAAGGLALAGTLGQPDAGWLVGSGMSILGGFWAGGPGLVAGVGEEPSDAEPTPLRFYAPAPNPFRSRTTIAFDLSESTPVDVRVFDVAGAVVGVLHDGILGPGHHRVEWGDRASASPPVPGLYFVRVRLGGLERTQKLIVLR